MRTCIGQSGLALAFNTAMPSPSLLVSGSIDDSLHRAIGMTTTKEITITGTGAEVVTNCFTLGGPVEILALYGVFSDVTNVAVLSGCWWDIWDGTNSVPLTLDGVDCSTASLYSTIVKNGNVSSAAYFGNSSQVRFQENPTAGIQRPFIGGLATGKNGVTNYVRFRADTAVATNCKIRMVCDWVSHYPLGGSGIVAV